MTDFAATTSSTAEALALKPLDEILDNYLARTPLPYALFRTTECRQLRELVFRRPILEIGCGDGLFAKMAVEGTLDVAIDPCRRGLKRARRTCAYRQLICGDARRTPFADESFRTIVAVSVLEHVADPRSLVSEMHRVLEPGGSLAATIVLEDLYRQLLFPHLCRLPGLSLLGRFYRRLHKTVFRHVTLLSQEEWERLFLEAGFQLVTRRRIVSRRTARWFDLLLPTAWPYWLANALGLRVVWRPRWLRSLLARLVRGLIEESDEQGACLFLVTRKKSV